MNTGKSFNEMRRELIAAERAQRDAGRALTDPVGTRAQLDEFRASRSQQANPLLRSLLAQQRAR